MLSELKSIHTFLKVYNTGGNPVLVTCNDFNSWICKHGRLFASPLFNEVIGSCFARLWELRTPEIALINVSVDHLPIDKSNTVQPIFFNKPCFGSFYIEDSQVIDEPTILSFKDESFKKKLKNKEDFLLIALFDIWLSNEDRNYNNSNLLLDYSDGDSYYFTVFDHDAIFNSNSLNHGLYLISDSESIISTDLAKILFVNNKKLVELVNNIVEKFYFCVSVCKRELKNILSNIPEAWNLNISNLEANLIKFLFNED
ncbi:HipA family kinase [Flavobacterium sp. C4GT6]|uniref:HipA family kinase n=1 Tax=Flavobacterium sp. C4GT6 TaxID=3103818 RepID=UPI002ED3C49F